MSFPRKSIVLAAGLGTRLLPTTKVIPKELLPLVDTPCIDFVAREAAQAGSDQLLIVTNKSKASIVRYFQRDMHLEQALEATGKSQLVSKVRRPAELMDVVMVEQTEPLGIAHALACTEPLMNDDDDAVAVLLPDDLLLPINPVGILEKMAAVRSQYGGSVLCAFVASPEELSSYGVFSVEEVHQFPGHDFTVARVRSMVEKPALGTAPSCYAAAGRYILDREIFAAIKHIRPGAGGEYQLTDAIDYLIQHGHQVHVVVHTGLRHDTGNPLGYVKTMIDFALQNTDIAQPLREWLIDKLQLPM